MEREVMRQRIVEVQQRIEAASAGRQVELVAISKRFPAAAIETALSFGLTAFGENYSQELLAKQEEFADESPHRWHFTGRIQRNKIKKLVDHVSVWHTVDSMKILDALARHGSDAQLYLQVNTTGEAQKAGCLPSELPQLVEYGRSLGLHIVGLMTMGPSDGSDPTQAFESLQQVAEKVALSQLSMGMSGDYEKALACGSTCVRIGSAIFGSRPLTHPQ